MIAAVIPVPTDAATPAARAADRGRPRQDPGEFQDRLADAAQGQDKTLAARRARVAQDEDPVAVSPDDRPLAEEPAEDGDALAVAPPLLDPAPELAPAAQPPELGEDVQDAVAVLVPIALQPPPEAPPVPQGMHVQAQATESAVESGGQPVLADKGGGEMFALEALDPAPAVPEPLAATSTGGGLADPDADTEGSPDNAGTAAAAALDVDTAELDGLLEPEAVAEAAPEPQDTPELPVAPLRSLRIKVDDELSLDVSTRSGRVDVSADGTTRAVAEIQDLGPELAASLRELGFELGGFSQQERGDADPGQSKGDRSAGDGESDETPRRASGGRFVNRLA